MFSVNSIKGIVLNRLDNSPKGRKENYTHEEKYIKYILHQKYILSSSRGYLACLLQTGAWVFPNRIKKCLTS
jgi:hypothetical protein